MSAIIYRLTNIINGKTYIGLTTQTLDKRWRRHISSVKHGSTYHLHNAIRKYGPDAFTREVLEETTTDLMNDSERLWIAECSPEYNMTDGGEGILGLEFTDETRAKMRENNSGSRNPFYGRKHTDDTIQKMKAAQCGSKHPLYGKRGIDSPRYGQKHSAETIIKLRESARQRKPVSDETRMKMRDSRLAYLNNRHNDA